LEIADALIAAGTMQQSLAVDAKPKALPDEESRFLLNGQLVCAIELHFRQTSPLC
jgi:hypothetical protein